jgi:lipoate-protein ligase A
MAEPRAARGDAGYGRPPAGGAQALRSAAVREITLVEQAFPGRAAFDTAVSRALLLRVAEGRAPETFRLYRPDDVLAFSVLDRTRPGFAAAARAASAAGFEPVLRLAGGRAAAFHGGTLAFAWSRPVADLRGGIEARFAEMAEILVAALRALGVDARVGDVPGEYCPGSWSVNAGGRTKLAGIGQRVVRGAAHVGGVLVVRGSARVREALAPVYAALGFAFDPATAGSVEDELGSATLDGVAGALHAELARRYSLLSGEPDAGALALAEALAPEHRAAA